jgi:hypothetical protein
LSGLSVGTYSLIISDSIACLDTINIVLVEPDLLEMSFENYQSALLCHGAITTVEILVTGGVAPYAVLWNDGDTNVLRTIFAGSYNCVITDANGCVVSDSLIIIGLDYYLGENSKYKPDLFQYILGHHPDQQKGLVKRS